MLQGVNLNKAPFVTTASAAVQKRWDRLKSGRHKLDYVKDRFNHLTKEEKASARKLAKKVSSDTRKKFYKKLKSAFPREQWMSISLIEFIHSHQRLPIFIIIQTIFKLLCGTELRPISIAVIKERGKPDRFICYDGQHTLIVLYLLGYKIAPVEIRVASDLAEVRRLFRSRNGKGYSKKVSPFEEHRQDYLSYVEDNCRDKDATMAKQIQDLFERNGMAMSDKPDILNSISRLKELKELKTVKRQQMLLDCYHHRTDNEIDMEHPGCGSKEAMLYSALILQAGLNVKQINTITDYLHEYEWSVAYASSEFWNEVEDYSGLPEGGGAIAYLRNEFNTDPNFKKALKKVGVKEL